MVVRTPIITARYVLLLIYINSKIVISIELLHRYSRVHCYVEYIKKFPSIDCFG